MNPLDKLIDEQTKKNFKVESLEELDYILTTVSKVTYGGVIASLKRLQGKHVSDNQLHIYNLLVDQVLAMLQDGEVDPSALMVYMDLGILRDLDGHNTIKKLDPIMIENSERELVATTVTNNEYLHTYLLLAKHVTDIRL